MAEPSRLPAPAYVYVIGAADGPQKIGVASDTESRRAMLQTGNPAGLTVVYRLALSRQDAFSVERRAHAILSIYRVRGEWFDISPEDAVAAIEMAHQALLAGRPEQQASSIPPFTWQDRLKAAGLSQLDLARLAGTRPNAISQGLRGKGKGGVPIYLMTIIRLWERCDPAARQRILDDPEGY